MKNLRTSTKSRRGPAAAVLALSFFGAWMLSAQQTAEAVSVQTDLEARVSELEEWLAVEIRQNKEMRKQLDDVITYLEQHAKSAKKMSLTLDTVEDLGFVPGINHPSRQELLDGWRVILDEAQRNLPKPTKTDKSKAKEERPRQRKSRTGN